MKNPINAAIPFGGARPGRRERRRTETRERIFRTALALFAERGFTAVTVEDITEAADVGKGTFFNYFPSKEHVLAAFSELQLGKVQGALAAACQKPLPMRKQLHRLIHALAKAPSRSPGLARSLLVAIMTSETVRELIGRNLARGREGLAELISLGQERNEIRRDRPAAELARLFQQSLFGAMMLWAVHPVPKLTQRVDGTFEVYWSGICARPSPVTANRRKRS